MILGILVNTNNNLETIVGLTEAATARNHSVIIFAMDDGARLLQNDRFVSLHRLDNVEMSFCEHSTKELAIELKPLPGEVISGSQYNNAQMNNRSDAVIVL